MINNPERGFRHEIDRGCTDGIDNKTLAQLAQYNLTVAQTYCYLPNTSTLSAATIASMDAAFNSLRRNGIKALWRFAYDRNMPGENYYTADTIMGHISQLSTPFKQHHDALYVLQAGFIGSWGEWHSSQTNIHANASAVSSIVEAELFELLPSDRKINVRVPVYKLAGVLRRNADTSGASAFCIPTSNRIECKGAFGGINASQCAALGCCFFPSSEVGEQGATEELEATGVRLPQCYTKVSPLLPSPSRSSEAHPMAYGVLDATTAKLNTAVGRIGYDNDGFMSTSTDGGTWGPQLIGPSWADHHSADTAPFPRFGYPVAGSVGTPAFGSTHGPMVDPDYDYARRESAWVRTVHVLVVCIDLYLLIPFMY